MSGPRDVEGPGANVATLDPAVADDHVTQLVARLGVIHPAACCAGAAGAEVAQGRARLDALLRRLLPDSLVSVVHDARLVLAAAGLESGIALIAGTGSVAYGRTQDGREAQRGGWGWMIGDEGSGVWIAREAARLVMSRHETGHELGALGDAFLRASGAGDPRTMVLELHALQEAKQWAALATKVFDTAEADAGSREIISRAGVELARRAIEVQGTLGLKDPVVLAGGLLLNKPRLEEAVRKSLPHVRCVRLEEPPVEGAVRLAEDLLRA
ncbi:MAG TPA: BadF/BadG/BcrA/BcrD ATPase family protein [Candidatus Limnocylindria bacterium]|nr:BadF/BadG/BcrA/BcrD ATPase family protein [Candidatus Limnocylindria bacterium]